MTKRFTLLGLLIAYFSLVGITGLFRLAYGSRLNDRQVVAREVLLFLMAAVLVWITRQEGLTLISIGLFPQKAAQSVFWALLIVMISFRHLFWCLLIFQRIGCTTDYSEFKPVICPSIS